MQISRLRLATIKSKLEQEKMKKRLGISDSSHNVFFGSECTMKNFNLLSNEVLIGSKRRVECF